METSAQERDYLAQIENLVFEGGGIKGLAFLGAMQVLEEHGVLVKCKRFAGSSAGAITAALLACGFSCSEVSESMLNKNWLDFIPEGRISQFRDVIRDWGLHTGDPFVTWFGGLVQTKFGKPDITFQELYERTGRELVVTAACVNRRMQRFFHHTHHPNMSVVQAVRMSMSIPVFFVPIKFEDSFYCDGGLLNNFPLWVFDCDEIPDWARPCFDFPCNPKTLGFKLLSDAELKERKENMYPNEPITSFSQYLFAIVDAMLEQMDRLEFKPGDAQRIIVIPTHTISSTDFNISPANRQLLLASGRHAMLKFIRKGPPRLPRDESTATDSPDIRTPRTAGPSAPREIDLVRARVAELSTELRDTLSHLFQRDDAGAAEVEPTPGTGPAAVLVTAADAAAAEVAAAAAAGQIEPALNTAATKRGYCELM